MRDGGFMKEYSPMASWYSTLRADAMYYHAAMTSHAAARGALQGIEKAKNDFSSLRKKEKRILDKHKGDTLKAYDELEPLYITMESAEHVIGAAYGPYLQNIAITHILCCTSAEAHINMVAKEKLKGIYRDHFEKISLEGKWLLLPKILGRSGFDQGSEPFQSFSVLVNHRNKLMHFKEQKEKWKWISDGVPSFLEKLGLSLHAAEDSLKSVRDMILMLSEIMGWERPYWLRKGYDNLPQDIVTNFFDIEIKQ